MGVQSRGHAAGLWPRMQLRDPTSVMDAAAVSLALPHFCESDALNACVLLAPRLPSRLLCQEHNPVRALEAASGLWGEDQPKSWSSQSLGHFRNWTGLS